MYETSAVHFVGIYSRLMWITRIGESEPSTSKQMFNLDRLTA